jgi:hypothetical protein
MASTSDEPIPIFPPPPGRTSNWVNPESIYWQIPAAGAPCIALSLCFCALRLYTSGKITKRWHWDDTMIAVAQVFAIIKTVIDLTQVDNGLGRHIWDVTPAEFMNFNKFGNIGAGPAYNISLASTKVSILLFYLRFPVSKLFKAATFLVMFVVVGNCIAAVFAVVYLCQPIARNWDFTIPGKCGDGMVLFWVGALVNMTSDILILLLPIWLLMPLRLPARRMFGVALILMSGGFVCALTIVRVVDIPKSMGITDITWDYVNNFIWVFLEMNIAIVCACLPSLPAFTKHHFAHTSLFRACTRYTITQLPTTFRRRWRGPSPPSTINVKGEEYEKGQHVVEKDLENQ